jgi:hypothetical protein
MTRKDYIAIAETLRKNKPYSLDHEQQYDMITQWERCVRGIAGVLASDNPLFDRRRFFEACVLEE